MIRNEHVNRRRVALGIFSLSVLSAVLLIVTPMRELLTCKEAWDCHYFSFQSPWPWLLIEEPLSVLTRYTLIFVPLFFFFKKLEPTCNAEQLFWWVLSLYGAEFIANAFIAVTLVFSITSVKYFVLFIPYVIYALQSAVLAYLCRGMISLNFMAKVSIFFILILLSTLAHSYIYRYLVNIYANIVGVF